MRARNNHDLVHNSVSLFCILDLEHNARFSSSPSLSLSSSSSSSSYRSHSRSSLHYILTSRRVNLLTNTHTNKTTIQQQ